MWSAQGTFLNWGYRRQEMPQIIILVTWHLITVHWKQLQDTQSEYYCGEGSFFSKHVWLKVSLGLVSDPLQTQTCRLQYESCVCSMSLLKPSVFLCFCVGYLCWWGGLQSVKAKRSAERSLVKIGEVTGLEGSEQTGLFTASRRITCSSAVSCAS